MVIEPHTLIDLWDSIKPYLQPKEKRLAAEGFVSILDEAGLLDEVIVEVSSDKYLSSAMKDLVGDEELDEEEY